ncbi:pilus assembly protein TadG-related protein [Streptomyces sp. NPDC006551]|uniref:pilus assembly protein TadG-related protein n=1 Tax=Streptomyces sp. NPDC006551 TaxID=3157178 RepID=UPI0033A44A66
MARRTGDAGQAFPIYVTVVGGLLFLAFAYFAVGQAAATRNGAQTAADAAALAAAHSARDQLRDGWLGVIANPSAWPDYLDGGRFESDEACGRAGVFAAKNDAELWGDECVPVDGTEEGFRVTVRTRGTVGASVIPGTDERHAIATATAVVEPRCTFDAPESEPTPAPAETPDREDAEEEGKPILGLSCDGVPWEIDPENPTLPSAADLFIVRLSANDE